MAEGVSRPQEQSKLSLASLAADGRVQRGTLLCAAVIAAGVWCYWPTLAGLARDWRGDPNYSVGQLTPLAALYLLWIRREELRGCPITPSAAGAAAFATAQMMRLGGLLFLYESVERYSIILTLASLVLLVGGWRLLWRLRWLMMFLLLMVPLPGRVHNAVSGPLQDAATSGAVFMLELAGVSVVREGHTILLNNDTPLAVAEACSGLRMLTAFVVVAATLAGAIRRSRWQKVVVVVSSIPVAVACNLARLFITALLYLATGSEAAERFFHDFAGMSMMPLAIVLLAGELWLMNKLVEPVGGAVGARAPL